MSRLLFQRARQNFTYRKSVRGGDISLWAPELLCASLPSFSVMPHWWLDIHHVSILVPWNLKAANQSPAPEMWLLMVDHYHTVSEQLGINTP